MVPLLVDDVLSENTELLWLKSFGVLMTTPSGVYRQLMARLKLLTRLSAVVARTGRRPILDLSRELELETYVIKKYMPLARTRPPEDWFKLYRKVALSQPYINQTGYIRYLGLLCRR